MVGVDPKRIAAEMAQSAASYIMIAPDQERDGVLEGCVVAFQEALADVGISASASDVSYYLGAVTAAVEDMKQREVKELPPKVTRN